jgi:flagellin-like hook-associated protein FlgL
MRSNLLSLQNINKLMDRTQERLSTGLKVNSAIDNPSSYYTAQSLNNRANDLEGLLDSMGQAVQTIQAANEGIESITSFLEQAKSVANQIMEKKSADADAVITSEITQYNSIMGQITTLAGDASYKGINLLKDGGALTVTFNEGRTSSLTVTGFDASAVGLLSGTAVGTTTANILTAETVDDKYTTAEITTLISGIDGAISTLRSKASELGNAYSILETRQNFTENLVNVLTQGADSLTLADMNEESANMLALQTQQSLAINSLSLASQAAQSVLRLF